MEVKCDYCGNLIKDTENKCPYCGAPNDHMARAASNIPQTIDELRAFCAEKGVTPERMHFHIGEDYKAPKAFGIFKDSDGNYVVYKNKADGTRAIRYRGKDEAYAVNEIYQKLKAEILEVRERAAGSRGGANRSAGGFPVHPTGSPAANRFKNANNPYNSSPSGAAYNVSYKKKRKIGCLGWILIVFIGVPAVISLLASLFTALGLVSPSPQRGYYDYNGETYYHNSDGWYAYDGTDWYQTTVDDDLDSNFSDYLYDDYSGQTFDEDEYYSYGNNWSDDWDDDDWSWSSSSYDDDDDDWSWGSSYDDDDDWDWDSGSSWDSGSDWDSDW